MNVHHVQGSSSIYTVTVGERDGAVCRQEDGSLCLGWKNSKGTPKTCKHVKLAMAGKCITARDGHHVRDDEPSNTLPFVKPVSPMLASTMDSTVITDWSQWSVEEKFDGHRVVVMVSGGEVTAWSRSGKSRELPSQVEQSFAKMPNGLYDGELMGKAGGTFADVRRVETQKDAYFVCFDVLNFMGDRTMDMSYDRRRLILEETFAIDRGAVILAESHKLASQDGVVEFITAVWAKGGEGAILKRRASTYQAGKRSKDFVKVKKGGTRAVTVVGFEAGLRGPYSIVLCVDPEDGMKTTVKNESKIDAKSADVGRLLRIEYTEKTDAAFVNPRSDRWENK